MIEFKNILNKYCIIDGGQLLYAATQGNKVKDDNGNPIKVNGKFTYTERTLEEVTNYIDNMLISWFTHLDITHYLGFIDTDFKNSFRKELNHEYKANRIGKEAPRYLKEAKEYLIQYWDFIPNQCGEEADDLCKIHVNEYKSLNPILICNDKDLLHCSNCIVYNGRTNTIVVNTLKDEKEYLYLQMLMGDVADNIKGVPGIGEVKGLKLLRDPLITEVDYPKIVFNEYIRYYGELKGPEEYYKNYNCLYIRNSPYECPCEITIQEWKRVPGTY